MSNFFDHLSANLTDENKEELRALHSIAHKILEYDKMSLAYQATVDIIADIHDFKKKINDKKSKLIHVWHTIENVENGMLEKNVAIDAIREFEKCG